MNKVKLQEALLRHSSERYEDRFVRAFTGFTDGMAAGLRRAYLKFFRDVMTLDEWRALREKDPEEAEKRLRQFTAAELSAAEAGNKQPEESQVDAQPRGY